MAVISSAFESSLSLSAYIQFSSYLQLQNLDVCKVMNHQPVSPIAHGLGTYQWLKEDVTTDRLGINYNPHSGTIEASVANATNLLEKFKINHSIILRTSKERSILRYQLSVNSKNLSTCLNVQDIGESTSVSTNHPNASMMITWFHSLLPVLKFQITFLSFLFIYFYT